MIDPALISYVGVMSVTPGPNNLLLAASGVHFGWRRTVPHVLGISFGHFVQVGLVVALFGAMVGLFGGVRPWLAVAGGVYLLWLSWKIAHAGAPADREGGADRKPMGFFEAALFQAVNPKAWIMVINVALFFAPQRAGDWAGAFGLAALSAAINLPCVSIWALTGDRLRKVLARGRAALIFNGVMASLMAGTALWLVIEEFLGR